MASPRTPQLGRSISSQYASPGNFRPEQEDVLVYELSPRHFSAGYAGESKPRCILPFTPDTSRRAADYRQYDAEYIKQSRIGRTKQPWADGYELYLSDLRHVHLGLVEDKLERALRTAMVDYLQIDAKARRGILIVPSMLPTPLLDIASRVLFNHFTQPPSITVLPQPVLCCISAGLRHALVVDLAWEESIVTAIGEYKEVAQRRSIRAGKLLTREMGHTLNMAVRASDEARADFTFTFDEAEDVTYRLGWCQQRQDVDEGGATILQLPLPASEPPETYPIPFAQLAVPAEKALFAPESTVNDHDEHDLPLSLLAYRVLLSLPLDLRALCVSRIVITGHFGSLPGLKRRLLQEITYLIETCGWDPVTNYGSAKISHAKVLKERSANIALQPKRSEEKLPPLSPRKMPLQEDRAPADRVHDDIKDDITLKVEREAGKGKVEMVKGVVRGVETLGAWAGASLMASLRIKGAYEVEREDYFKHGLRNGVRDL